MSTPSRRAVLGALAVLPVAPAAAHASAVAGRDGELARMAGEIAAIDAEQERLREIEESIPNLRDRERFREERMRPLTRRSLALVATMATTAATTMVGFRAKARILQCYNNCAPAYADPWEDDALAWSLANDLLGMESVWRPEDDDEDGEEDETPSSAFANRTPEERAEGMLRVLAFTWDIVREAVTEPDSVLTLDRVRTVLPIAGDVVLEAPEVARAATASRGE